MVIGVMKRLRLLLLGLVAFAVFAPAADSRRPDEVFFAGQIRMIAETGEPASRDEPLPALQPGQAVESIMLQGHSASGLTSEWIDLTIFNRTSHWFPLSYITDTFVTRLDDGRTLTLDKDFLRYPAKIAAGGQATIKLLLPQGVWARDVSHVNATLDNGRIAVLVKSIPPLMGTFPGTERPLPMPATEPIPDIGSREQDLSWHMVPVLVEFEQEMGGNLKLDIRWDADGEAAQLGPTEYETFHLMPGLHYLYFWIRMPSLAETKGSIPVLVNPAQVVRVAFDGRPHLTAAEARVRVWQKDEQVFDQTFGPQFPDVTR